MRGTWVDGVSQFVALTEFSRCRLAAAGIPESRIAVVGNFVGDSGQRNRPPSASNRIAYVGRLSAEKGLLKVVEAWRRARPSGLKLFIVGDGPQAGELRRHADRSVVFTGTLPRGDVDALMRECRAVIYPSICFEGQPLAILEAFAAGTAVLGSELGGVGETLKPLGPEWRVRGGSAATWARALSGLVSDTLVDVGGERARAAYEINHTPDIARGKLEATYRRLAPAWDFK